MDNKELKIFTFLKQRKTFERLDVFPFIILHSICLVLYVSLNISIILKLVLFGLLFLSQFVVFFSKYWSEALRSKISFKAVKDLASASHVRIDIVNNKFKMNNRAGISEIVHSVKDEIISIEFEKIKYLFNKEKGTFEKSKINFKRKLGEFKEVSPYSTELEIEKLKVKYGNNLMKVPIPSFFSLYKEHIVAPFFVFQLFCILLWVFDDYGLHSGMTLLMLCIFEATVVAQRIVNLVTLRKMRVPPHFIYVYRNHEWKKISSSELIPGDIVSVVDGSSTEVCPEQDEEEESSNIILKFIKKLKEMKQKAEAQRRQQSVAQVINRNREKESSPLTCDLLILSGSAIVNEAMLTGESVPQIKESLNKIEHEHNNYFDYKSKHKNSVLFSGTKIVKVSSLEEESDPLPLKVKSSPPDNGCVCLVLKTGFGTSQGKLLRTVLYSSERTKGDSSEAWVFIFILLFFALWAAYYVLKEGIEREGELTYKLFLRTVIIITSVVPAELPIELTLAINNSLFFLQSKAIVCIEPFRIPFAGKVKVH
jgi:cation-transporting ATPase 13A1